MGLKKLGKWVKKNIKPIATVAAILYPPLIPAIGSALVPAGASAVVTAAAGAAALSGAASAVAGDSTQDILKNAALGGITAGAVQAVSPTAFDSGLFSGSGAAPAASTSTGSGLLSSGASSGTGLTAGGSGLGLSAGGSGLGITAGSAGASTIGGTLGAELAGISTGIGAAGALSSLGSMAPVDYGLTSGVNSAASLSSEIASKGLLGDVVNKVASFTGLTPDTVGKLGVAGVQALLTSAGASKQAEQARQAAQTQADATIEAARISAEAAKFRPVGVTTRFGASNFGYDAQGNVISAGYTPSAEITGYQDRLRTLASQGMGDIEGARAAYQPLTGAAQSLFSLGQGYLAKSPEQAAQDYITKQQALITPSRQTQLAEVQNRLFQQGRGGAATAQGGNLMATSPELAAYYNALAQQDLVLAAEADQAAQQRIQFGSGLFDTGANLQGRYYTGQTAAYAPFATAMDTSVGLENLAQQPLEMGVNIGGRTTAGTAAGGRFLGEGIINAAATMAPANAYSASGNLLSGFAQNPMVSSALNNAFGVQPQQRTYTVDELKTIFGT